jgi:hypothetical protein
LLGIALLYIKGVFRIYVFPFLKERERLISLKVPLKVISSFNIEIIGGGYSIDPLELKDIDALFIALIGAISRSSSSLDLDLESRLFDVI